MVEKGQVHDWAVQGGSQAVSGGLLPVVAVHPGIGDVPGYGDIDWTGLDFGEEAWNEVMALEDTKLAEQRADNAEYLKEMTAHLAEPLFGDEIFKA